MRKKTSLIIVIILSLLVGYLAFTKSNGTIKSDIKDFAIEDTALVDKIFLVDKENKQILLERDVNNWRLNENYTARKDLVDVLLKTMLRIKVKEPVSNAAKDHVIKSLAVKSTKVEMYCKGKLNKVFYVGGPTKDSQGTYMIMEGSASPFVMELPGFRGYLSPRFTTELADWRSHLLYAISVDRIKSLQLQYFKHYKQSFTIINDKNALQLLNEKDELVEQFDAIELRKYLLRFRQVGFSKFIDDVPEYLMDSIAQSEPFFQLSIEDVQGEVNTIKGYIKPAWGVLDEFGNPMQNDINYFFVKLGSNEMVYAQYFVFDPILKGLHDF